MYFDNESWTTVPANTKTTVQEVIERVQKKGGGSTLEGGPRRLYVTTAEGGYGTKGKVHNQHMQHHVEADVLPVLWHFDHHPHVIDVNGKHDSEFFVFVEVAYHVCGELVIQARDVIRQCSSLSGLPSTLTHQHLTERNNNA